MFGNSWADIDLDLMKQNDVYGNDLHSFLSTVGEYGEDWCLSPIGLINHEAPTKIYFSSSDKLMAFYLVFSDYVTKFQAIDD